MPSAHQEQVELGWPGCPGAVALPVLNGGGRGGPRAESDLGKVPLCSQRGIPQTMRRPQLSEPLLGGQHVLWALVLIWPSSAGGSGKGSFSPIIVGPSLGWGWLTQHEQDHQVPVSQGFACHMHIPELCPDPLNGNLEGGWVGSLI